MRSRMKQCCNRLTAPVSFLRKGLAAGWIKPEHGARQEPSQDREQTTETNDAEICSAKEEATEIYG
jgi:hypothetical protein